MKSQVTAAIAAIASGLLLAACASKNTIKVESEPYASQAAEAEKAEQYKKLVTNADQQIVCRKEASTGSRITNDYCMTKAQLEAERAHASDVMRDIQSARARPTAVSDGGMRTPGR